jgi:hypothetical protein
MKIRQILILFSTLFLLSSVAFGAQTFVKDPYAVFDDRQFSLDRVQDYDTVGTGGEYADLNTALDDGATNILLFENQTLTADDHVPSGTTLCTNNYVITLGAFDLTFDDGSRLITSGPPHQIFSENSTGFVTINWNSPTVYVSWWGSGNDNLLDAEASFTAGTLVVTEDVYVDTNTTIDANKTLVVDRGAVVRRVTGDETLTFAAGSYLSAGPYQITNADMLVFSNGQPFGYAEWYGVDGTSDETEINYAIAAVEVVQLLNKRYTTDNSIDLTADAVKLLGCGCGENETEIYFDFTATQDEPIVNVSGNYIEIRDIRFRFSEMVSNTDTDANVISFSDDNGNSSHCLFENLLVWGGYSGITDADINTADTYNNVWNNVSVRSFPGWGVYLSVSVASGNLFNNLYINNNGAADDQDCVGALYYRGIACFNQLNIEHLTCSERYPVRFQTNERVVINQLHLEELYIPEDDGLTVTSGLVYCDGNSRGHVVFNSVDLNSIEPDPDVPGWSLTNFGVFVLSSHMELEVHGATAIVDCDFTSATNRYWGFIMDDAVVGHSSINILSAYDQTGDLDVFGSLDPADLVVGKRFNSYRYGIEMAGNISLNDYSLSNDGDDEGIYVDDDGNVGINEATPASELHITRDGSARVTLERTTLGSENISTLSCGDVGLVLEVDPDDLYTESDFNVKVDGDVAFKIYDEDDDSAIYTFGCLTIKRKKTLADDGTFNVPDATSGWGQVKGGGEYLEFRWAADGTVTLLTDCSANTANTDSDTDLCAYDSGTQVIIKNRLGGKFSFIMELNYK